MEMKMEETPQRAGGGAHYLGPVRKETESVAANSKAVEKDGQVTYHSQTNALASPGSQLSV